MMDRQQGQWAFTSEALPCMVRLGIFHFNQTNEGRLLVVAARLHPVLLGKETAFRMHNAAGAGMILIFICICVLPNEVRRPFLQLTQGLSEGKVNTTVAHDMPQGFLT